MKQGIHEASVNRKYPIGLRYAMDERVFRYAKVGDCSGGADLWEEGKGQPWEYGLGVCTMVTTTTKTGADIVEGNLGKNTVKLAIAGVTEDEYAGGYLGIHDASGHTNWGCRIKSNTATDGSGNVTFTLETLLPITLVAGDSVSVTPNPYSNVSQHSGPDMYQSMVGVCLIYAASPGVDLSGKYIWLQTWGPLPEAQIETSHEGGANKERQLWFKGGRGSMQCEAAHVSEQLAGFYMPCSKSGSDLSHPVVWLTIAP